MKFNYLILFLYLQEDTISINHNWINGCNILNVWKELERSLIAVMKEIEDCSNMDNWPAHCQVMLKASHGMDYTQFYDFLSFIIARRLNAIDSKEFCISFNTWQLGIEHTIFDLNCAKNVLKNLIEDTKKKDIYQMIFCDEQPEDKINIIESVLKCKDKNH